MTAIKAEFNHMHEEIADVQARLGRVEERMTSFEERITRVERTTESTLTVVQSIDAQFKEWKTLPHRMEKVE